jgi:hypothetical protein
MKNNTCIILVGRGNLAQALIKVFNSINQEWIFWDKFTAVSDIKLGKRYFIIYCSNTENFKRLISIFIFSNKHHIPFINVCTDFVFKYDSDNFKTSIVSNDEVIYSIETNTILVNANNFIIMIVGIISEFKKIEIIIPNSHQAIKIAKKVYGIDDYAYGALQICEKTTDIEIGVYDVDDLF